MATNSTAAIGMLTSATKAPRRIATPPTNSTRTVDHAIKCGAGTPIARKIVASVEIAHEDAGPFEFAVALARPDERVNWQRKQPDKALAFSGWTRVEETFELRELSAELPERVRTPLSVHL